MRNIKNLSPASALLNSSAGIWLLLLAATAHVLFRLQQPLSYVSTVPSWDVLFRAALASAAVLYLSLSPKLSDTKFLIGLVALALLSHFPGKLTFHWDEWDLLWRYTDFGIQSSFTAHGAHVMPVFNLYFYLLLEVLQFNYPLLLIVSSVWLGLNGWALAYFLQRLGIEAIFPRMAIRVLCCLFVISSLQIEVTQWAFIQCVTAQNIATLLAAAFACSWMFQASKKALWASLGMLAVAPLLQGTGVITVGFCLLALMIAWALHAAADLPEALSTKQFVSRTLRFTGYAALASLPAVALYVTFGDSPSAPKLSLQMFEHIRFMLAFFFNGTLGVTVMRGTGLFPSLGMDPALTQRVFTALPVFFRETVGNPDLGIASLGGLVLLFAAVALFLMDKKRRNINAILFVGGCLIIAVFFALPTLGRWQYGIGASIHQRYQTRHLVGFALICIPLISQALFETRSTAIHIIGWLVVVSHVAVQMHMEARFNYFVQASIRTNELICRSEFQPNQTITKDELKTSILPHWAFAEDTFRRVLDANGVKCQESREEFSNARI